MQWDCVNELVDYANSMDCAELNRAADMWNVVLDEAGCFLFISPHYFEKTGFCREQVIGRRFVDLVNDDLTPEQILHFEAQIKAAQPIRNFLFRRTHPDGRPIYVRSSAIPQFDLQGGLVGYLGHSQDISEVVDEIVSDGLLDVFDNCPLGVTLNEFDVVRDGVVQSHLKYVNETHARRLGYSRGEFETLPNEASWRDKSRLNFLKRRIHAGEHLRSEEVARVDADGRTIWLEMTTQWVQIAGRRCTLTWHNDVTVAKQQSDALQRATRQFQQMSVTDDLTQLANRREFDRVLEAEWNRGRRHEQLLGVMLIDVDNFKDYNDALGHTTGDECLQAIALALANSTRRGGDLVARYGGEEFGVIIPATSKGQLEAHANSLREAVARLDLPHPTSEVGHVTVSVGVCVVEPGTEKTIRSVLDDADNALYRAKASGRNRVEVAWDSGAHERQESDASEDVVTR